MPLNAASKFNEDEETAVEAIGTCAGSKICGDIDADAAGELMNFSTGSVLFRMAGDAGFRLVCSSSDEAKSASIAD